MGLLDQIQDPSLRDSISQLMGGGQLSDEDKKYAQKQGLLNFAAHALMNMYKPTGQGLGAGLAGGIQGYNDAQQTVRRNKLVDAENMQKAIQTAQGLQGLNDQTQERKILQGFYAGQGAPGNPQPSPMGPPDAQGEMPAPVAQPATQAPASPKAARAAQMRELGDAFAKAGRGDKAQQYYDAAEKMMPKVKEQSVGTDQQGNRVKYVLYEDGTTNVLPIGPDKEKAHFLDVGNKIGAVDPFTGKPIAGGGMYNKEMGPGEADASARGWAGLRQADSHFKQTQANQPGEIKETADGLVRVGKDNSVTPIVANGAQLQPKPTGAVVQQIASNNVTLAKIDKAMGVVSKNKDAFGLKNLAGDTVMQRVDPSGVEARAIIADIAGQKIHDRSGAAVTVGESERLKPYVPNATDNADTIRKKLILFKSEYQAMQKELAGGKTIADIGGQATKTVKWSDLP